MQASISSVFHTLVQNHNVPSLHDGEFAMLRKCSCRYQLVTAAAELDDPAAVAFGRPALRRGSEVPHGLTLFSRLDAQLTALLGFFIESMSDRRRAAYFAQ